MTLTTYDADIPDEGELVINGNAAIALFGIEGLAGNDQNSASVTIITPASYWNDGQNTLLFRHTRTTGYVVDNLRVSFDQADSVANNSGNGYPSPMNDIAAKLIASGLIASGPIVIDGKHDVVISGMHITNPSGSCVEVKNSSTNITIKDSVIGPCKDMGVDIVSSENVTIRNTYIHDTKSIGIRPYRSEHVQISSNQFENIASGVYAGSSKQINVTGNYFLNVQGPFPRGQLVQFDRVTGAGNRINNNLGVSQPGASDPQDAINLYRSRGTADDYIQVNGNTIIGGGPSTSGGGIILGDRTGSYQIAENNILVNPGSYGISVSAGHHLVLSKNKVFTDGSQAMANTGVIIGYQAKVDEYECRDMVISNNEITFWRGEDQLRGAPASYLSPYYKWSGCNPITGWETNKFDKPTSQPANLDTSILPIELQGMQ